MPAASRLWAQQQHDQGDAFYGLPPGLDTLEGWIVTAPWAHPAHELRQTPWLPCSPFWGARQPLARCLARVGRVGRCRLALPLHAAPAPWYYWRSKVDGARVCAQTSPGPGWERDSPPYEGPGCQPRTKVIVVPMR